MEQPLSMECSRHSRHMQRERYGEDIMNRNRWGNAIPAMALFFMGMGAVYYLLQSTPFSRTELFRFDYGEFGEFTKWALLAALILALAGVLGHWAAGRQDEKRRKKFFGV